LTNLLSLLTFLICKKKSYYCNLDITFNYCQKIKINH